MMGFGVSAVGVLFCLLGTVVVLAVAFFGIRYFLDYAGHGRRDSRGGPWSGDYEQVGV